MAETIVTMTVSEDLVRLVGSPSAVAEKAREALVLELLRKGEISQGKAAELLGIPRWDMMQLAARAEIPFGPQTAEELEQDLEVIRRYRRQQ